MRLLDKFAELVARSPVVARIVCPHPEHGFPEAEITRIYRKPDAVATDPFRYFLGVGNDQRVFDRSKAVTLTSRVWIGTKPILSPATTWMVDWVVTGQRIPLGPWRIECHLCAGGPRFRRGHPRQVKLGTANLCRLAEGLLARGQDRVSLPGLQQAMTA